MLSSNQIVNDLILSTDDLAKIDTRTASKPV